MSEIEIKNSFILGQKHAYATVALILGIFCFVSFLGLEKAILAIVFASLALRAKPEPALARRRVWAQTGLILGILMLIIVPLIIILNFDRLREILDVLSKMSGGR